MAGELATGYVQIVPSMRGMGRAIEEELNGVGESAGKESGASFGLNMKKYISAAAIGTALYKSISEGAQLEQALGGVETLYGKHAQTVINYADQAWKTAGISANDYMEQSTSFAAALLQSLGGNQKAAAEAANMAITDMADNANKMGTDLSSIQYAYQGFAKGNYTMLDNLKLGYGGTKTEMERLLADAEKLPEAMGRDFDLNNLDDVYTAIHLIQGELGITGTTSKEAATTLSGSFMSLKASFSNFLGDLTLGRNIAPAMQSLVDSASTFLFANLIPAVGTIFKSLPAAMGQFVSSGAPMLLSSIVGLVQDLASAFTGSGDIIKSALNGLLDFSGLLAENAGQIVDAGLQLALNLANGIASSMPTFIATVPTIITNIANIINNNAPKFLSAGVKILGMLAQGIISSIPTLVANLPAIFRAALAAFTAFGWASLGKAALRGIANGIKAGVSTVTSPIKSMISKVKGMFPFSVGKIMTNLRVPHINVSGGSVPFGIGGAGTPPKISVSWHKDGGIFDGASIIGYGVGEAGAEAIVPLDPFWDRIDAMAEGMASANGGGTVNLVITLDGQTIAKNTISYINGQTIRYNMNPLMF